MNDEINKQVCDPNNSATPLKSSFKSSWKTLKLPIATRWGSREEVVKNLNGNTFLNSWWDYFYKGLRLNPTSKIAVDFIDHCSNNNIFHILSEPRRGMICSPLHLIQAMKLLVQVTIRKFHVLWNFVLVPEEKITNSRS